MLLNRALEVGVSIKTSSFVSEINEAEPSVVLRDGSKYTADLVIGADGSPSSPRIVASAAKSLQASNPACEEPLSPIATLRSAQTQTAPTGP